MHDHICYVMTHAIQERQERLRRCDAHWYVPATSPSRLHQVTGDALIRLGERLRGELGELRETGATPARA